MFSKQCKHVPHNNARAKTTQVFFTSNDALPKFFFNQSPVLFLRPRVAHTEWCRPVIYNSRPRSSDARLSYAPKPVVVAVPTGPRYLQDLSLSRGGRSPVLLACPPCCWPLTGLRAASRCRHLQVASRGCRAHESVDVESRYARVDPHFNPLSARPAADAARTQYLRKRLTNKKEQEQ